LDNIVAMSRKKPVEEESHGTLGWKGRLAEMIRSLSYANLPMQRRQQMRKALLVVVAVGGLTVAGAMPAAATSISAKLKSSKVQGDLVPAWACAPLDENSNCSGSTSVSTCTVSGGACSLLDPCPLAEDKCTGGNKSASEVNGRGCTFDKGTFKVQSGKDAQVQVSGLKCTGGLPSGLCGHIEGYSTIMNQNVDAKGVVTPKSCVIAPTGEIAGASNFAIASLGTLTCDAKGTCKGVLPLALGNPCPDTDSETQIASIDIFDGAASASITPPNSSITLKACCGRAEYVIPGAKSADQPACQNLNPPQDVLATMGNVVQIK
jgi:hypothetical protein